MPRPATRERRERFIADHDTMFAPSFHKALKRVMDRHRGLSFFTDEQIEEIVAEMVRAERWSHSFKVKERSRYWREKTAAAAISDIRKDLAEIEGRA